MPTSNCGLTIGTRSAPGAAQAVSAGSTSVSEMKDRSATTSSAGPPMCSGVERADVGPVDHAHPGVGLQPPHELSVADVDGDDLPGAPAQQHVGEAAGRRAGVQAAPALHRRRPGSASSAPISLCAPRDAHPASAASERTTSGAPGSTPVAGLVAARAAHGHPARRDELRGVLPRPGQPAPHQLGVQPRPAHVTRSARAPARGAHRPGSRGRALGTARGADSIWRRGTRLGRPGKRDGEQLVQLAVRRDLIRGRQVLSRAASCASAVRSCSSAGCPDDERPEQRRLAVVVAHAGHVESSAPAAGSVGRLAMPQPRQRGRRAGAVCGGHPRREGVDRASRVPGVRGQQCQGPQRARVGHGARRAPSGAPRRGRARRRPARPSTPGDRHGPWPGS